MSSKNKTKKSEKTSLPVLQFTEHPVLVLSEKIISQVSYLHNRIGKAEWSGILLYSHVSGSIDNADEMILKAEELFLMDIGSSAYTEYTNDVDSILDMFDMYPGLEDGSLKQGHIHTHHNLGGTSFSGTDMGELQDNAPAHNYYLSLIMDFTFKPTAKIATVCEVQPGEIVHPGATGTVKKKQQPEKRLGVYDCIISFDLDKHFQDRFSVVRQQKIEEEKKKEEERQKKLAQNFQKIPHSAIPQNVKGWEYGIESAAYSNGETADEEGYFFDPIIDKDEVEAFLNSWFLSSGAAIGDLDDTIGKIQLWLTNSDKSATAEFVSNLEDNFDEILKETIGQGYFLTNDEYLKVIRFSIEILDDYKEDHLFVEYIIEELEIYKETIESEIEAESLT